MVSDAGIAGNVVVMFVKNRFVLMECGWKLLTVN